MGWLEKNKKDCKQATFLIEKQQQVALDLGERIKLKIHLYNCSWCKTYQQQSKNMQLMIVKLFNDQLAKPIALQDQYKNTLKSLITNKLKEK